MGNITFMPHQEQVLQQTEHFDRVAYYLDMGLGKTFVGSEKMWQLNNQVNIVVCQKSKINDWVEHFQEFYADDFRVFNLTKKTHAIHFRNWLQNQDLYQSNYSVVGIINYDLVFRRKWLADIKDFALMLDESSLIQHETTQRAKFILKMQPKQCILLSGTPTSGKYEALWSQLRLLGWNISKKAYWKSYVDSEWVDYGAFSQEVVKGYKHVEHLKKKLAEYGAVFMKTEEVLTLPERIEQMIYVQQSKEYKKFMKHSYVLLNNPLESFEPVIELIGDNSLTKLMYARQLCGQYHNEKLNAFKDLVSSTEDRLIVFYNFTAELEAMQKVIEELHRPYSIINGKTKDLTAYNNDSNSITFIQYQAGAMGGNYQLSNKIIYFSLPLGKGSCDLWEQSKKRIHRIGQTQTCFYYYLLVKSSVEERNLAALKEGKELTDDLFKKDFKNVK